MSSERTALILWDIDHTLIESRGAGTAVYEYVFPLVTGVAFRQLAQVSGRTELDIIHDTLSAHDIEPTNQMIRRLADALADGYRQTGALADRGRVLPGVEDALAALAHLPGIRQSVLTGNTTEVAKIKLETFGLDQYLDLDLGAYGDDHHDRAELVAIARRRATERLGHPVEPSDVLVIGDTPNDVTAALQSGAHILGVASGRSTMDELKTAGATNVVEDLVAFSPILRAVETVLDSCPSMSRPG